MSAKSKQLGASTSRLEVVNISAHGFWLSIGNEELFVPYGEFPWFRGATIAQITSVTMPSKSHLYWPELDIDLSVASIRNPASFPLVSSASV
jgi:hypothetical protein